jgi:hypothetical protein
MLLLIGGYGLAEAALVSSEVYPSDDEIFEAYLLGDIDFQTYLNLKEIFEFGVDSTEIYLLEEIPNIDYFRKTTYDDYSELEIDQTESFIAIDSTDRTRKRPTGSVIWRRYQKLDTGGASRENLSIDTRISPDWKLEIRAREGYEKRRDITRRSLIYTGRQGFIRKLVIGNYTARYGLGLTVGYRGGLLDKDGITTEETLLFPDYGAFNGLYGEGRRRNHGTKLLVHYDQDSIHRFKTVAAELFRTLDRFRYEFIVLGSIIENRHTDFQYKYYQFGGLIGYSKYDFDAAVELAFPKGTSSTFPAAVLEIKQYTDDIKLRFSAWHYGSDFKNLTGGARAGNCSRTMYIDTIDFKFTDRRNDQRGLLFKSITDFTDRNRFDLSFSIYGRSRYNRSTEILTGMEHQLSTTSGIRLYYEYDRDRRESDIWSDNKARIEYRYRSPGFNFRSYLGFRQDREKRKYLSFFARPKIVSGLFKSVELWADLAKFNTETSQIDYFYGYIKEIVSLTKDVDLAAKFRYRYNRHFTDKTETEFFLELKIRW